MVTPRQLILVVLVVAVSTISSVEATQEEDELQQLTFSQGEDSTFPQVTGDAEITDTHDDQEGDGSFVEGLPERMIVGEPGDGQDAVGDDGSFVGDLPERMIVGEPGDGQDAVGETKAGGEPLEAGGERLKEDLTDSGTNQSQPRSDVDEPVKKVDETTFGVPRCEQESNSGICRAYMPSWYYDAASATCQGFIYGGCAGNDNNFPSKQHCEAACPDVVLCPENPSKMCLVSESACMNSTCSDQVDVICRVTPCTCEILFVDLQGHHVSCNEPTVPLTTPGTEDDDDAGHDKLDDEDDNAASKNWMTPTFVTIGIITLVVAVTAAWVVGRRWRRQAGSGYISANSGKPSQYPQTIETQAPEQCTDGSLNV